MTTAPDKVSQPPRAEEGVVLVVDDDAAVRTALERVLRKERLTVYQAASAEEALELLAEAERRPQVLVSDYRMPGMDGVTLLGEVRGRWPAIQRILITGQADIHALERAINESDVYRLLSKPFEEAVVRSTVRSALAEFELRSENERLLELTQSQNAALFELNKQLEARVNERTALLERAKRDWESTFDSIIDPVSIIELDYTVRRSNRAFAGHAGIPVKTVPGRKCHVALTREQEVCKGCPVGPAVRSRQAATGEVLDRHRDRTFQVWAFPILDLDDQIHHVVCYYRDVTEEKELQQKLVQTEKMAAVGQLAGGVAHEINNPLGGILAFTQLLMRDADPEGETHSFLSEIEASALRCKRIVENLLKFSRRSPGTERSLVNINEVVESTLFLVEYQFQFHNVEVKREVEPSPWPVKANANHLGQVLLNLVTNAIGATDRGGRIKVRTWNDTPTETVCLSVTDTGQGIPAKYLSKIYEPFFTTKDDGTGLGLTITYDIVQAHGGTIRVDSQPGKGTTFTVALPAARGDLGIADDLPREDE